MNKYNSLLKQIAYEFGINQGVNEQVEDYKCRIVYSLLGRMGYSSLYDISNEEKYISITHFKRRIQNIIKSYVNMYPELHAKFGNDYNEISQEIYQIYLDTGNLYHENNHVFFPMRKCACDEHICFTRGYSIASKQNVSGLGTYTFDNVDDKDVTKMFGLSEVKLNFIWDDVLDNAIWSDFEANDDTEYLRIRPPFNYGYWTKGLNIEENQVSVLRVGREGEYIYYIYRKLNENNLEVSSIPGWLVENHLYRELTNACLSVNGTLPPTIYKVDGNIVHVKLQYLYPVAELNFFKLYSWPTRYLKFPADFERIMAKPIFFAFKRILEQLGYTFKEEENYG